jgi:pilus assembly protein Flp/PilA
MYHKSLHKQQKEKGQGLVEYAMILVLVAIVVIAALMILGPIIGNVFSKINTSLGRVTGSCSDPVQYCSANHISSGTVIACSATGQQFTCP